MDSIGSPAQLGRFLPRQRRGPIEEMKCLQLSRMRWENVSPALPKEVGSVDLESVLEFGSRHYTQNFEEYLLAEEDSVSSQTSKGCGTSRRLVFVL